jgi:hypothetical protein
MTTPPIVGAAAACPYTIQATTIGVANLLQANSLYASTFIYQSSDFRLKRDIQPVADGMDGVMKLKPVSYILKSNGMPGLGFIAQDVEKVYPQLVTKGDGMKAVNYEGLIAPLVDAVQHLKHENDDLRQRLDKLEKRQSKQDQATP